MEQNIGHLVDSQHEKLTRLIWFTDGKIKNKLNIHNTTKKSHSFRCMLDNFRKTTYSNINKIVIYTIM